MARRVSLPAADDLFRPTSDGIDPAAGKPQGSGSPNGPSVRAVPDADEPQELEDARKAASGRIRHDEKMTVYVTSHEMLDIERARLTLRGDHGLAVDRGRLVREALALVLADLNEQGADSMLVRRITAE